MTDLDVRIIPLDQILEPSIAARSVITLEALEEMADSITKVGILQNLLVKPMGSKFEIVDGHRRYLGAKMAGKSDAPCRIMTVEEQQAEVMKLQANYHREDMNAVDEGVNFQRMRDKFGFSIANVARMVSKSESYVSQRLALLNADPSIQEALKAGHISVSQVREIMKSPNERVRLELLRIAIENGASVNALRIMRADYDVRAGSMTQVQAQAITSPDTPGVVNYAIECPTCANKVSVNEIYPLSVCKTCHDGIIAGARSAMAKHKE